MPQARSYFVGALVTSLGLLTQAPAGAASLQQVSNWGASGVPTTVSMYLYVPDKLATKPPVLVLSHFCGGTASAVFGQAQSGGIVKAADQYGFIIVVPQTSKNCWDVGSTKSLTHDGGGDTQAVAQMVKYAITKYAANPDRVYATGDSSGGMMTQALLAVYPDVFKAGSAFAGVPAGCWAVGNADGSWSGQCAGGQVTHTPQEWGNLARDMYKTYSGHRPRVQLFHGDADMTIKYPNFTEAIKQWTNVLGLSTAPTSTDTVTLGTHQATRQRWQDSCGFVVLDAFTSKGGDHGPSDALFNASFVVPFLGLDQSDAVDPEIAKCGSGGMSGTAGAGGVSGSGGTSGHGGADATAGGSAGGNVALGGASPGGANNGGESNGGSGPGASGNGTGTGGLSPASGGSNANSGTGNVAQSGSSTSSGAGSATAPDGAGCSCTVATSKGSFAGFFALALALTAAFGRRNARRPRFPSKATAKK